MKVIIEETISQEFEIDVENVDDIDKEILKKYKNGEFTVDNPTLTGVSYQIIDDENDECTNWIELL